MKKFIGKRKYEGQALAITMVVLVVSALIGLSIYSRTMRDHMLTLEERASAEALEVSDFVLERLTLKPIGDVVNAFIETAGVEGIVDLDDGIVLTENDEDDDEQISELLRDEELNILGEHETISDFLSPICSLDQGGNEYQLTLKSADEGTVYEVKSGNVWALPVRNILQGVKTADGENDCTLSINFEVRGDSRVGFVVSKIYCEYEEGIATKCQEYEINDFDKRCFSPDDQLECTNVDGFYDQGTDSNWGKFDPDLEAVEINMSLDDAPSEIRIKAVGGTVGISYSLPPGCREGLRMFQLRATANCQGVYRGKEILIPEQKWHQTIFDYVIFNAEGSI